MLLYTLYSQVLIYIIIYSPTGLDVEVDTILEMACIVTDTNLNIVAEVMRFK